MQVILLCLCATGVVLGWRWWSVPTARDARHGLSVAGANASSLAAGPQAGPQVPFDPGQASALRTAQAGLPAPYVDPTLQALVERSIDPDNGTTAVYVRNLRTGASAAVRERDVFPSASLAKVPILTEAYRRLAEGTLHNQDRITVTADAITDGAGVLQAREGDSLSVSDLLRLSVTVSDNVAARLIMQHVGGVDAINAAMANLGLTQTRLYSDSRPNTTTAGEMASLFTMLAARDARPSGASAVSNRQPAPNTLAALLSLPQAQAWLADGVGKGTTVAHKSGQLPGVRNEAAVVYSPSGPYVLVVLTQDLANQDDAETFITDLSRQVFTYFG